MNGVNEVNSPYVENINENIDLIAEDEVDLGTYLRALFDNFYSEFILSFGVNELMASLGD